MVQEGADFVGDFGAQTVLDLAGVVVQPVLVHFESFKQQPLRQAVAPHKIVGPPPAVVRQREMAGIDPEPARSEEHTSELQSQSNLVCRLLLEKKKKK